MSIRTLLFDMGNVCINFSHERMFQQIAALCDRTPDDVRTLLMDSGLQIEFERGTVSEEEFCERLSSMVDKPLDLKLLRRAGSDIFKANMEMFLLLRKLERRYRLVLLSNTSVSHFEWIHLNYDFLDAFDSLILSFEVGAVKPEPKIFEAALDAIECPPEHCFYTDDIAAYVEQGRLHGLNAEVFTGVDDLHVHLKTHGVIVD